METADNPNDINSANVSTNSSLLHRPAVDSIREEVSNFDDTDNNNNNNNNNNSPVNNNNKPMEDEDTNFTQNNNNNSPATNPVTGDVPAALDLGNKPTSYDPVLKKCNGGEHNFIVYNNI